MSSHTDIELEAAVHAALYPTWAEIVQAKHALRAILADGQPHGVRTLQSCLLTTAGIPVDADRQERLQMTSADDIARVATPDHPLLARHRLALAATEALIDLAAQGLVIEVANAPDPATGNPLVGPGDITIGYQLANLGAGIRHATALPQLPAAYRLTPRHVNDAPAWFLDPDLFAADLRGLELDRRTRRCVTEALDAYCHGQFLACANLLGAASEGAWYAAGVGAVSRMTTGIRRRVSLRYSSNPGLRRANSAQTRSSSAAVARRARTAWRVRSARTSASGSACKLSHQAGTRSLPALDAMTA
jgi:hypothetical protein